jgi:hypothetical protein
MNADTITCLFKEAYNTPPPLKGKPTNNGLLAIRETLSPFSWSSHMTNYWESIPSRPS